MHATPQAIVTGKALYGLQNFFKREDFAYDNENKCRTKEIDTEEPLAVVEWLHGLCNHWGYLLEVQNDH